jgi:proteasome assembly chaperone (PAC2) family protein
VNVGGITAEHVIFIPGVLLIGLTLGYVLGARAVRAELAKKRARMHE